MDAHRNRRQTLLSWLFVATVAALAVLLGVLQYRWIGEVSVAERDRLRTGLQASLRRLSQDFNSEITAACAALMAPAGASDEPAAYAERYLHWKESTRHGRLFRRIALTGERHGALTLLVLDPEKAVFENAPWPEAWQPVRERFEERLAGGDGPRRFFGMGTGQPADLIELPRFLHLEGGVPFSRGPREPAGFARRQTPRRGMQFAPRGEGNGPFPPRDGSPPRERGWLIVQFDLDYVRTAMIPELLHRYLAGGGKLEYDVEIVVRDGSGTPIYRSHPDPAPRIGARADASIGMFALQYDQFMPRRPVPSGPGEGQAGVRFGRGPGAAGNPLDRGRWEMLVRHRAGSLETLVAQTRTRNLAVTCLALFLMLAAVAALVRFTQRSQRLARLQMEFVAGVSHELRTPLSVIRTAAHNLNGGVVSSPGQVQRYGGLIEQEAERLTAIVEQVLRFASAKAGRPIGAREPVPVGTLIDDALAATAGVVRDSGCRVEKCIEPGVPPVLADPVSLSHALQNLLTNAAKHGGEGGWIGVSARVPHQGASVVEIRVADRGPGIPADEIAQIFDPFYRGKRAVDDQIHGTGLGLNLVKRIVEAHQGTVSVESAPGENTEFLLRIPAAAVEQVDELAHSTRRG
jgi:signal transduction histidine kinase